MIPDQETQDFVAKLANHCELWIGATDEKKEGEWLWVDGTPATFTAWLKGEPSNQVNSARNTERFVQMRPSGGWNDSTDKNDVVVGFICEWSKK